MLPEIVRSEELLRAVALSKLVHLLQIHYPDLLVLLSCDYHLGFPRWVSLLLAS